MVAFEELAYWQDRLDKHFKKISQIRSCQEDVHPIFALEHGLDSNEIDKLSNAIRSCIRISQPKCIHFLPWIVYATELGYQYSGDEYWQTFETDTPGWKINGDRNWLRNAYKSFQKQYNGASPTGHWAEHFSIICWPITHALLPKDLQQQLARVLYESRGLYSAEIFESPTKLGELIADRSWHGTSRFQNFVQGTKLLGQIAKALLLDGNVGTDSLIFPATLRRVRFDLERERIAREWLKGARRSAGEKLRIRGLDSRKSGNSVTYRNSNDAKREALELGIEPRLVLRRSSGKKIWKVFLQIPDLTNLVRKFPRLHSIIAKTRCTVTGAVGRPLARGRCLYGAQLIELSRWPHDNEILLKFEQSDELLDFLFRTECLLRPDATKLFALDDCGIANERRSLLVRPGKQYIVTNTKQLPLDNRFFRKLNISCEGVYGALIDLSDPIDSELDNMIRGIGLDRSSRNIEVWPSGLSAVAWDGEGHGEWLASERPCLAIRTDHLIADLTITASFDPHTKVEIGSVQPGIPVFVEFPQLPVGVHLFHIAMQEHSGLDGGNTVSLNLSIRIRESRDWIPGDFSMGPLLAFTDPFSPTMEELWEGNCNLSIYGPKNRKVACKVTFILGEMNGGNRIFDFPKNLGLPINSNNWYTYFEKFRHNNTKMHEAYDMARECQLEFTAEELGAFRLHFERHFTPLRWALGHDASGPYLILIDNSGISSPLSLVYISFEYPAVEEKVSCMDKYRVPLNGGLFLANRGESVAGIIAPPNVSNLKDLSCSPIIQITGKSVPAIQNMLRVSKNWGAATLPGNLFAVHRKCAVLKALTKYVCSLLAGGNFASQELNFEKYHNEIQFAQCISRGKYDGGLIDEIISHLSNLTDSNCETRVKRLVAFGRRARIFSKGCDVEFVAELSLRVASDVSKVLPWAGTRIGEGLQVLLDSPTLVRASRFLVLVTAERNSSHKATRELYPSWSWK